MGSCDFMASVVSIGGGAKVIGSWQKVPRLMASLPSVVFGLAPRMGKDEMQKVRG